MKTINYKRTLQDAGQSSQSVLEILNTGIDVNARKIYIMGEIDPDMAYRTIVSLQILDQSPGDIRILINSHGGHEGSGYAIYDAIKLCQNRVIIEGYGEVQSISALILQAGEERLLSPECRFMIHNGFVDLEKSEIDNDALISIGKEITTSNKRYHAILSKKSGISMAKIRQYCEGELYLSAAEAVKKNFADAIITYSKTKIGAK